MSAPSTDQDTATQTAVVEPPKRLPKGVVLGKDGKPCRSCTSFASWAQLQKHQDASPTVTSATITSTPASTPVSSDDCPPDVEGLGRSTWTFLHTLTANYPERATPSLQVKTSSFLTLFSELYPCWVCAEDFQRWIKTPGNEPRVESRGEFGLWMCRAHNAVNVKLGKKEFDCDGWEGRWRTGVGKGAGKDCA